MKFLTSAFKQVDADQVAEHQLFEARRALLEHEAAAEFHEAMSVMYRGRVERLEVAVNGNKFMPVGMAK